MKIFPYRICHLAKYYPPHMGGIETHIQTLARAQSNLGAEVDVLCVNGIAQQNISTLTTSLLEETDGNVRVRRVNRLASFARFDICPELYRNLSELVDRPNTLIHLHTPNPTMLVALMELRPQRHLVITHHSDIIKQRVLKYAFRPIEHFVYTQASQILTTSYEYIEGSKFLKIYKDKLSYVPLGLDCSQYLQPNQSALQYAEALKNKYREPIWLCVGRLVYYKAIEVAIEALALMPGTLIVIGTGPLENQLKSKAKQLGLENRIVWHGYASPDELVGAYYAATALLFPSNQRSEGFGLVQVEAMASGCPVVNTNIPGSGVPWVSRHEKEGLTVPLNNSVALAQAAKRLLTEPGLRDRFSRTSRDRAVTEFSQIKMAQRSFEIYEQALYSPNTIRKPALVQAE